MHQGIKHLGGLLGSIPSLPLAITEITVPGFTVQTPVYFTGGMLLVSLTHISVVAF